MNVFGRDSRTPHPYASALHEWLASSDYHYRALARNVMHDHRVSARREQIFESSMAYPRTARELEKAIVTYFETRVRTRPLPDYVFAGFNFDNFVTNAAAHLQLIHRDVSLVRVLDITGLHTVFQWAKNRLHPVFAVYPTAWNEVITWLDAHIGPPNDVGQIDQFIETILEVLNSYRLVQPFQPTWATAWAGFERFATENPDVWAECLGMKKTTAPRWLILLRYTVREAGTIARPSQLDAGWYSYHFPSPPQAPLASGGHPMDLRAPADRVGLLPEFIHKQISHSIEHFRRAGSRMGRTTSVNNNALNIQREYHLELLTKSYGSSVRRWMPRCT